LVVKKILLHLLYRISRIKKKRINLKNESNSKKKYDVLWDDANVHPDLLLPKVKDKIFVIVKTISPFGSHPKGLFSFQHFKF